MLMFAACKETETDRVKYERMKKLTQIHAGENPLRFVKNLIELIKSYADLIVIH